MADFSWETGYDHYSERDSEGLARSKTYIDSILYSFGTHSPIVDKYIKWTVAIFKKQESGNDPFLQGVIDYLAAPEEGAFEQLAVAEQAFHKWLGSLPEDFDSGGGAAKKPLPKSILPLKIILIPKETT